MTDYLTDQENKGRILHIDSEIFNIRAADPKKNLKIETCSILVSETVSFSNTTNLPTTLKMESVLESCLLIWVKYCTWK